MSGSEKLLATGPPKRRTRAPALKQPDDLKSVYDAAFDKVITTRWKA